MTYSQYKKAITMLHQEFVHHLQDAKTHTKVFSLAFFVSIVVNASK